jgi:hypothetical protein
VKLVVLACLILALAALYYRGAVSQLTHANTNMKSTDQSAYMDYARNLYESNYTFIGGRNRMPIYPTLQSLFYRPGMSDEEFFTRGKYVNAWLSLGLLGGLALILRRFFPPLHTLNLMLIIAFTVFVFKAGWFQTELLFYFVNFCLFLLMCALLNKPSYPLAILTGIVAGLAHLTKASILPGFVLCLLFLVVQWAWALRGNRPRATLATTPDSPALWLTVALLAGLAFLGTVYPYIRTSKRVFGHYFYNVNSTFYMWYDSWAEAKEGTRAHGDRVGWPDMDPQEIPSMSKYFREHTLQQVVARFVSGGRLVVANVVNSYGYFTYVLIYGGLLTAVMLTRWAQTRRLLAGHSTSVAFLLAYFATYLLLYTWYGVIIAGNRLVLAQFPPLMFVMSYGLYTLLGASHVSIGGRSVKTLTAVNLVVLAVLAVDVYLVLTERVSSMYGGY